MLPCLSGAQLFPDSGKGGCFDFRISTPHWVSLIFTAPVQPPLTPPLGSNASGDTSTTQLLLVPIPARSPPPAARRTAIASRSAVTPAPTPTVPPPLRYSMRFPAILIPPTRQQRLAPRRSK